LGGWAINEAMAVQAGQVLATGPDAEVLRHRGPRTEVKDLAGQFVLPGLLDSHAHPVDACLTEFDHPLPTMDRIADVVEYVAQRTRVVPEGQWIVVRQVFITRRTAVPHANRVDRPRRGIRVRRSPDAR
jgi:predicted amidohydrolase YtcJ